MPGSFVIRPIEAKLTHNTDLVRKMSPYCTVSAGGTRIKGQVCKKGGKHPHWTDAIFVPSTNQAQILFELMDKDTITRDDNIGSLMLDLREVQTSGQVSKWYQLTHKNKVAGEILLETVYQPSTGYGTQKQSYQQGQQVSYGSTASQNQHYQQGQQVGYGSTVGQNQYYQQGQQVSHGSNMGQNQHYQQGQQVSYESNMGQNQHYQQEQFHSTSNQPVLAEQEVSSNDLSRNSNVWVEQRQAVEPHRFLKEVEATEIRSSLKEVEVMEPVRMMKEVAYTQAVPVKKQIEVSEPEVVIKEIEVMEPRLVTKTIQVVENVSVVKQVEVVEMRSTMQEVRTFEPQTFTKQVEVTEYVPKMRAVQVTEPVTLKKAVQFVEPVITTETITKEMREAVIIDEKFTTEVGPASIVGMSQQYGHVKNYGEISLGERERLTGHKRWIGFETVFTGLSEQERLFEQQRLSRLSEEEWLHEQERLSALNEQDRLLEQRRLYNKFHQTGGFSTYKNNTSQNPNLIQNSQGFSQGGQSFTQNTESFNRSKDNNLLC